MEMESDGELAKDKLRVYREVIAGVREQPWPISRFVSHPSHTEPKLKLARSARAYLAENEGAEEERLAQSTSTRDICYRHFRAVRKCVNSYILHLNLMKTISPKLLASTRSNTGERKFLLDEEQEGGYDFKVLWNFEGMLRYSPFFYGYYSRRHSTPEGYRVPDAYFHTFIMIFAFSFIMIIRKMAANQRMSKLSYDKTEFSWSLLSGWDYAIGDMEAAQNKVAAINMGFRELLQGDKEKEKSLTGWRLIVCRCTAHVLVLILLIASAYAVVQLVVRSMEVDETYSWWRQNELSIVLTLISQIFPYFFSVVSKLEHVLPRQEVQMQLARIMALNLLNLTTFVFTLYRSITDMSEDSDKEKDYLLNSVAGMTSDAATATTGPANTQLPASDNYDQSLFLALSNSQDQSLQSFVNISTPEILGAVTSTVMIAAAALSSNISWPDYAFNSTTAHPAPETPDAERKCRKVAIPCSTPTVEFIDDYLLFPNDTIGETVEANNDQSETTEFIPIDTMNITLSDNETQSGNGTAIAIDFRSNSDSKNGDSTPQLDREFNSTIEDSAYINKSNISNPANDSMNEENSHQIDQEFNFTIGDSGYINMSTASSPASDSKNEENTLQLDLEFNTTTVNSTYPNMSEPFSPATDSKNEESSLQFDLEFNFTTEGSIYSNMNEVFNLTSNGSAPNLKNETYFIDDVVDDVSDSITDWNDEMKLDRLEDLITALPHARRRKLRRLCWETAIGQEIVKITVMDLIVTIALIFITEYLRAVFVRFCNFRNCCWDLEKQYPGYAGFDIAENIFHLINNQGLVW
ncbi:hypothetical protein HAZT_HAZT004145 [Hyalella azteca]|uniref:TMC domain-containing protein n=1 Tax=Hyalella azteca TaxID=294128 RepID=A0A6A0GQW4_HYAAZ|nr:hypothetical protein HAZT_HAZT004145 [Hyalella azteca]